MGFTKGERVGGFAKREYIEMRKSCLMNTWRTPCLTMIQRDGERCKGPGRI